MSEDSGSSSSSSFPYKWKYDVFLSFRGSFRGRDACSGFALNLYKALWERAIHTFLDDDLWITEDGKNTSDLLQAIHQSRTAIVIFSENYASSTFCLEELFQILDGVKGNGRVILPVFYGVDPSDVQHQKGSYKVAFDKYEGVMDDKLVKRWRLALTVVANLSDCCLRPSNESYEFEIIEEIIQIVSRKIDIDPLHVAHYSVGLESRVKEVCSLVNEQPQCDGAIMVGIHGVGGIGKTALGCAVYENIYSQFEVSCYLGNISEQSIHKLQRKILSSTMREEVLGLELDRSGISTIKAYLRYKKVLLILDDVDSLDKLRALAGEPNWFGSGSIIIITTRDKRLLENHGVKMIYEVQKLNRDEARQLLIRKAFRRKEADPLYEELVNRVVDYVDGLPLALKVIGSFLCRRTVDEWESALAELERTSQGSIQDILKLSYGGLDKVEQEIFLDIACFYNAWKMKLTTNIMRSSHSFRPDSCIRVLIDKALINIDRHGFLRVHNLIRDMGHQIVRQQSPDREPGKRSRLWLIEDILHVSDKSSSKGADEIQAIHLNCYHLKEVLWNGELFWTVKNLRVLFIYVAKFSEDPKSLPNSLTVLDWTDYPSTPLPSILNLRELAIFNLPNHYLRLGFLARRLDNLRYLQSDNLRHLNLEHNEILTELPDMSQATNLEELYVAHCPNLTLIHSSVGHLAKLRVLRARGCTKLNSFLEGGIKFLSLEILDLTGCSNFQNFPEISEKMENIKTLALSGTAIETLPESIAKLTGLECLYLYNCRRLRQIPVSSISKLTKLVRLEAGSCGIFNWFKDQEVQWTLDLAFWNVTRLHLNENNISDELLTIILRCFPRLQVLELRDNDFTVLPVCIKECRDLKRLYLDRCKQLREIRGIPPNIKILSAVNCTSLTSLSYSGGLHNQVLQRAGNRKFILPGEQIPEWFHCSNTGSSVSFWVRKKFPEIAVCVVFEVKGRGSSYFDFEIQVLVNGTHNLIVKTDVLDIGTGHIYLFDDLRHQNGKFEPRRELLRKQLNHVRISCSANQKNVSSDAYSFVKYIGVYVYNHESCVDDILFENPRRTLEDMICDEDRNFSVYSDSSREDRLCYKDFQAIEASENSSGDGNSYDTSGDDVKSEERYDFPEENEPETLFGSLHEKDLYQEKRLLEDFQWQQHLTATKEKVLESSENVRKSKGKDKIVYRDNANEEKGSNTLEDPMELEYQMTFQKDQLTSNVRGIKRDNGYGGRRSKQRIDGWYSCLCVIVSSVVLCHCVLHLLRLLHDTLECFLSSVGYMER